MSVPIPRSIPEDRLGAVEMRLIEVEPDAEALAFVYLTDTDEFVATDEEEAELIRSLQPGAKVVIFPL